MKNFLILLCIFLTLFISGCSGTENNENVDKIYALFVGKSFFVKNIQSLFIASSC